VATVVVVVGGGGGAAAVVEAVAVYASQSASLNIQNLYVWELDTA